MDPRPGGVDMASKRHGWSDERPVDCYRPNSVLLRKCGPDERTIRVLCTVEEHPRTRHIDPDTIIEGLDA